MSRLEIKSWRGDVLATTEKYDNMTEWVRSGDLSDANLSYANLSYANLSYANLRAANLRDANLNYAELYGCDQDTAAVGVDAICTEKFGHGLDQATYTEGQQVMAHLLQLKQQAA